MRAYDEIGRTPGSVDRLAIAYKKKPMDKVAVKLWYAIAVVFESHYRKHFANALDCCDAWMIGWPAVKRALDRWDPEFRSKGSFEVAEDRSEFLTYAIRCYHNALMYEVMERGTVVKIERKTKGYFDRYRDMMSGMVHIDALENDTLESVESLQCL